MKKQRPLSGKQRQGISRLGNSSLIIVTARRRAGRVFRLVAGKAVFGVPASLDGMTGRGSRYGNRPIWRRMGKRLDGLGPVARDAKTFHFVAALTIGLFGLNIQRMGVQIIYRMGGAEEVVASVAGKTAFLLPVAGGAGGGIQSRCKFMGVQETGRVHQTAQRFSIRVAELALGALGSAVVAAEAGLHLRHLLGG